MGAEAGILLVVLAVAAVIGVFVMLWRIPDRVAAWRVRAGKCGECGYDLSSSRGSVCPECGAEV